MTCFIALKSADSGALSRKFDNHFAGVETLNNLMNRKSSTSVFTESIVTHSTGWRDRVLIPVKLFVLGRRDSRFIL